MSRLIASMNLTLDGCCDHRLGIADDEHLEYATRLVEVAAGVLLGRVTYELFRDYWPSVARGRSGRPEEVAFARELEGKPKFVVSRDRGISGWNTSIVDANGLRPTIGALKRRLGGHLVVFGSPSLARVLLQSNAIDDLHLLLQPILAGRGPRAFESLPDPVHLVSNDVRTFRSGVILSRYSLDVDSGRPAVSTA